MMNILLLVAAGVVVFGFMQTPAAARISLDLWSSREDSVKWAGYGEEKLSTVVIAGTILCNAAANYDDPHPVSGASVAVLCGRKSSSSSAAAAAAEGSTDGSGKFLIDLPSHLHAIPELEKVCHVRVVQLPATSPCAAKHNKPIQLTSTDQGIRTYTTNNIHLTPP